MFTNPDHIMIWVTTTTTVRTTTTSLSSPPPTTTTTMIAMISKAIKFDNNMLNETFSDYTNSAIDDDEEPARKLIRLIFSISYFILFLFGIFGNGSVIVMIVNVLTATRKKGSNSVKVNPSNTLHVFVYILGLSVVDFLVIMHLPFLINELLYGQWLFGKVMCKFYWFGESVNKLLSSFIMTVLSWDRYLAVCSPIKSIRMRRTTVACVVLLSCSALAIILLLPVVINATVVCVDVHTGSLVIANQNDTFHLDQQFHHHQHHHQHHHRHHHYQHHQHQQYHYQHLTQTKCVFEESNPTFMYYTFACGFLLPALLITYFYLNVIIRLHKSFANVHRHSFTTKQQNANMRLRQVTKRIVAMILFYFFCWMPHWTLNLLAHFELIVVSWSTLTLSSIFFAAHLLVCFNSAVNPILYALINRELRQQHTKALIKRCRSLSNATNSALDALIKHSHHFVEYAGPFHYKFDATKNHDNQHSIRKEKHNFHSSTKVIMQLCSYDNPTITIDNDKMLKMDLSSPNHVQRKLTNDRDNASVILACSSYEIIDTTNTTDKDQSQLSCSNCILHSHLKVDCMDSFL
uniref:G_PROTEIN_RECEP_F1_2 domain-containing protein n=1 Tax=Onchocerca volvulus TaxID=6282 RepID=A0A8R1XXL5_ONCVO